MLSFQKISLFLIAMASSLGYAKPPENVETFLKSCYQEYVTTFASLEKDSDTLSAKVREKCLSKEFQQFWFKIISKSDADGLLLAQDYKKSWKTNVEVKDIDLSKKSAQVILGKKAEQHCVSINYINEPDLKIDIVSKCKSK